MWGDILVENVLGMSRVFVVREFRDIKVTDYSVPYGVNPRMVVRVWKNGMIEIREFRRRVKYSSTIASVYVGALKREVGVRGRGKGRGRGKKI